MPRNVKNHWKDKHQDAASAYINSARALLKNKREDEAIQSFRQALPLAPRNAKLHGDLGQLLAKRKQTAEAVTLLERCIELDPQHVPALIKLGEIHSQQDDFQRAEPLLAQALKCDPASTSAHLVMGVLRHHQNCLPEALDWYRKALRLRLAKPLSEVVKGPRTDFNKPEVEALVWSTLAALAKAGVHAFAAYGTLLGLTREGTLLPFDKDIDFGLPHCEMARATHCLLSNGWVEPIGSHRLTNPKAFFHPVKKISLDLSGFVVERQSAQTYTGFWLKDVPREWNRETRYPEIKLNKGLSPCNQPVWTLEDPQAWLETVYGDWRTPDAYFDTVIAAKNLCGFSLLTECYAISRIYSHLESGHLRKALALAGHALTHRPDDELLLAAHATLTARFA